MRTSDYQIKQEIDLSISIQNQLEVYGETVLSTLTLSPQ